MNTEPELTLIRYLPVRYMSTLSMIGLILIGQGATVTFKILNNLVLCIPTIVLSACQEVLSPPDSLSRHLSLSLSFSFPSLFSLSHPPLSLFLFNYKVHICFHKFKQIEVNKVKYENPFPSHLTTNPNPDTTYLLFIFVSFHKFSYVFSNKSIYRLSAFTHF